MVKHVVSDNTVEFYSFPKNIMPVMAIFRPQIAQNGLFSRFFDPKMLCLLCFCINNKYSMVKHVVSDNTVEFYSFPKKIMPVMAIFRPKMAQNGLFSKFFDPNFQFLNFIIPYLTQIFPEKMEREWYFPAQMIRLSKLNWMIPILTMISKFLALNFWAKNSHFWPKIDNRHVIFKEL